MFRFSSRIPGDFRTNRYYEVYSGIPRDEILDLTESNPTRCGIEYPEGIWGCISGSKSRNYDPDPKGLLEARIALATYLRERGDDADRDSLLLTSGTSEAYGLLMKVLAEPGDAILTPSPGYPLLDHLAPLEGMRAVP